MQCVARFFVVENDAMCCQVDAARFRSLEHCAVLTDELHVDIIAEQEDAVRCEIIVLVYQSQGHTRDELDVSLSLSAMMCENESVVEFCEIEEKNKYLRFACVDQHTAVCMARVGRHDVVNVIKTTLNLSVNCERDLIFVFYFV